MQYNLELEKAIKKINAEKAKLVCIQLPDGLKRQAFKITQEIEKNTQAKCLIWQDTCYGACDIPQLTHLNPKIDLLIQFGHTPWKNLKEQTA